MRPRSASRLVSLLCAVCTTGCIGAKHQSAFYYMHSPPLVAAATRTFDFAELPIDHMTDDYVHTGVFRVSDVWTFEQIAERLYCGSDRLRSEDIESATLELWVRMTEKLTNPGSAGAAVAAGDRQRRDVEYTKAQLGAKAKLQLKEGSRSCSVSDGFGREFLNQLGVQAGVETMHSEPMGRDPMLPGLIRD